MIYQTISFLNTLFLVYNNIRYDLSLFMVQKEFCVTFIRRGGDLYGTFCIQNASLHPCVHLSVWTADGQGSVLNWPFFLITSSHCSAAPSTNTACRFQGNEQGQSLSTSNAISIVWVYCVSWPLHIYIQSMWAALSGLWNSVCLHM